MAWSARIDQVWEDYYRELLGQAFGLEIEHSRLQELQTIASTDVWRACELLAVEIHKSFTGKLLKLRRDLHTTRSLRALLLRFASTAYRFHNKIVLQRRFYLIHGSHPTENPVPASEDRLDSQIGGCGPAFQI